MTSCAHRVRPAFTLTELLVSLALIMWIMAILSQAFVEGLETYSQLKGIGDLNEQLRADAFQLRTDVLQTNGLTSEFILESLLTGKPDPAVVVDLKQRYAAISKSAAALEPQLAEVEQATTNPDARQIMKLTLQALAGVKANADEMITLLKLIDPDSE